MAKRKTAANKPAGRAGTRRSRPPGSGSVQRQLNRLDGEIVAMINRRAQLVRDNRPAVGSQDDPIAAFAAEQQAVARALEAHAGPLPATCVAAIFRELISGCRAVDRPLRVAFLGPEYSYSHVATICRFGQTVELAPVTTIAAVFEEVEAGQAAYGIVPVENSTDGRIGDTLEMFARSPVRICGEVPLRIHHHLLATVPRSEIKQVYSKPQALSQCRNWIAKHLPGVRGVEVASTSEAARRAQTTRGAAAIAGQQAAVRYQLRVLARNIEDNPDNQTRFAVIGSAAAERTGDDKTSLLFEIEHRPGALADAMSIFKRYRLNMTWIESYPIRGLAGRYLFFVEFVGHQQDLRARRALVALEKKAVRLDVLGSYARMDPIG